MPRAFLLVLDSVGIGGAPDASAYGDEGADTVGHVAERRALAGKRFQIPNLSRLGLGHGCEAATGQFPAGLERSDPRAAWGCATERARGKDTPSGHWEIAGVPVDFDWGYFPDTIPTFPASFTEPLIRRGGLPGILANRHASGTQVIDDFGGEHVESGKPIIYTSADSVIQIAAHETRFGLQRLYDLCAIARELADSLNVGRVIARPFLGSAELGFMRTANRRDYSVPPPAPTLLDHATGLRREVITIGKIGDIFAHRGTGTSLKAAGNPALFDLTLASVAELGDGGLVMANFVDFDTEFGHRRDAEGYAGALESFDARLPAFMDALRPGDLAVITADHGCDPTWRGTDHTRERVPVLAFGPGVEPRSIGIRESFSDIGQTIARHLGLKPLAHGVAWS